MRIFFVLLKKELKELLTPQFVLPLIAMVLVFSSIGGLLQKETKKSLKPVPLVVANLDRGTESEQLESFIASSGFIVLKTEGDAAAALSSAREAGALSVLVIPEDYSERLKSFDQIRIETYSVLTGMSMVSSQRSNRLSALLPQLNVLVRDEWLGRAGSKVIPERFESPIQTVEHVVIGDRQAQASFAAVLGFVQKQTTLIPIILFLVIVIASQMVAVAVASEKENKTLETLLSTPVSRKAVVCAKLAAAGIVAFLFAAFYLYGLNAYMRGMMGGVGGADQSIGTALGELGIEFGFQSYVLVGASLFLGILVALAIAMILGTLADSVKNVQAVTTPLMILILVPYFLTLLLDLDSLSPIIRYAVYAIPFSHPFLAVQKIVTHEYGFIIAGLAYQLVVFGLFVWIASKLFSSDKLFTLRIGRRRPS